MRELHLSILACGHDDGGPRRRQIDSDACDGSRVDDAASGLAGLHGLGGVLGAVQHTGQVGLQPQIDGAGAVWGGASMSVFDETAVSFGGMCSQICCLILDLGDGCTGVEYRTSLAWKLAILHRLSKKRLQGMSMPPVE